jgi:hypothetical protein
LEHLKACDDFSMQRFERALVVKAINSQENATRSTGNDLNRSLDSGCSACNLLKPRTSMMYLRTYTAKNAHRTGNIVVRMAAVSHCVSMHVN